VRLLVLGGGGFLGFHAVAAALATGARVSVLSRSGSSPHEDVEVLHGVAPAVVPRGPDPPVGHRLLGRARGRPELPAGRGHRAGHADLGAGRGARRGAGHPRRRRAGARPARRVAAGRRGSL